MTLQTALAAGRDLVCDYFVFCSQDGELSRTVKLLSSIVSGTELSPADFSQSVHNTSAGLHSIITESRKPATSMAAGEAGFAYAWLEAEGYLAECGGGRVLLVDSDDELPGEYAACVNRAGRPYAMALVLGPHAEQGVELKLEPSVASGTTLPIGPLFLEWWLSDKTALVIGAEGEQFTWERRI